MDEIIDRMPPHNLEEEMHVLGSMMLKEESIDACVSFLSPTDFYRSAHQKIYAAILFLYGKNQKIDMLTVYEKLEELGQGEEIGGAYYLTELTAQIVRPGWIETHAKKIAALSQARKLLVGLTTVISEGYVKPAGMMEAAQKLVFDTLAVKANEGFAPIEDSLNDALERMTAAHTKKDLVGIPSGLPSLDRTIQGFENGDLIFIAGRPGLGKTALSLNIARNVTREEGKSVGIYSLEMSKAQLALLNLEPSRSGANVISRNIR